MNAKDIQGFFGPGSITWQLYREPIVMLGSFRALLLQIAHPAVAAGVAQFSNFKTDGLGRGFRTFKAMATIYFGTKEQAQAVGNRLNKMHQGMRGMYTAYGDEQVAYVANDPALLLWVLSTLTETTIQVFEQVPIAGLPPDWRERFFEESKIAAQLLGIPEAHYPADLAAFRNYFDGMLNSDVLGSSPVSNEMAQGIIHHRFSYAPLAKLLTVGWLPEPLCIRLGIRVNYPVATRWAGLLFWVKLLYKCLPRRLRYSPAFYQALHRIAKAEHRPAPVLGAWYNWLVKRVKLPLGLDVR